jgi:holin-like protein
MSCKNKRPNKIPPLLREMTGFLIIVLCKALGNMVSNLLYLPIPGSIVGMMLLFVLLLTGVVKQSTVEPIAQVLIGLMLLFILPGGVKLMTIFHKFEGIVPQLLLISSFVAISVIVVSGWTTQRLLEPKNRNHQPLDASNNSYQTTSEHE